MKRLDDFLQGSNSSENPSEKDRNVLAKIDKDGSRTENMDTDTNADTTREEKTFTFAHMADCHLGAFREERLRELNLKAFERSFDICIERNVDFIVISGDLFHRSYPDLSVVKRAAEKMKEAVDEGIRIYLVYGSHDYTASTTNLIDVLSSAGLFKKVFTIDSEANLTPVIDETGAELMGISGRMQALEKEYYNAIKAVPEGEFSIFLFHTAISELRPSYIPQDESIPLSMLPEGFDYYAGGHVHERIEHENIFYPGPLFGSDFRDLSALKERGFYIVSVKGKAIKTEFVPVKVAEFSLIDLDFSRMNSKEALEKLKQRCAGSFKGIVLLSLHGRLKEGSVADIDVNGAKKEIENNGAELVVVSRNITTEEKPVIAAAGNTREEIEAKLFSELFDDVARAKSLFSQLSMDLEEVNMSKSDFKREVEKRGFRFFDLEEKDDN